MRTPTITPMIRAIIFINIAVFVVQSINPQYDRMIVSLFGLHYFTSEMFNPIQLVTYMFVHADFSHILGNMFGLFFLGPILEMFWGGKKFLIFYFVTGIGAGLLYMGLKMYDYHLLETFAQNFLQNPQVSNLIKFAKQLNGGYVPTQLAQLSNETLQANLVDYKMDVEKNLNDVLNTPMIGASGAVFGIMAGFGLLFPNTELMLLFFPFPIKAKYFVTFYAIYEIYAGLNKMPGDNVAHFAHIGGMIFAFILIKIWGKERKSFY
jgi:membrane associated rhomboid family serine protease